MNYKEILENLPKKRYVSACLCDAVNDLKSKGYTVDTLSKIKSNIFDCVNTIAVGTCLDCGTKYFKGTTYCNNRLCPVCARRRTLKYFSILIPAFKEELLKGHTINFLTLTIKDNVNLSNMLDKLNECWRYMVNTNKFSRKLFNHMFIGGVRNIETKKGKNSKLWHPHMHLLIVKEKFSEDYYYIKSLWEHATQEVFQTKEKIGSVFIESIKLPNNKKIKTFKAEKDKNGETKLSAELQEGLLHAVSETVKYITKFEFKDYSNEDILELVNATHGKRFINAFGCMYNLQKDLDKELPCEEDEAKDMICKHCGCTRFELEVVINNTTLDLEDFN